MEAILESLETQGYHVIPNYFKVEQCQKLVKLLDQLMTDHPEKVQRDFKEGMGGDYRLFGIENVDQSVHDSLFNFEYFRVVQAHTKNPKVTPCTALAGKVEKLADQDYQVNSGGGWHRDPGSQYGNGIKVKAIIYLSDVAEDNGPFTIIPNSRRAAQQHGGGQTLRFSQDFVDNLKEIPVELTAKAGTMIIADVGNIHLGKPINSGKRYSLTYYFQRNPQVSERFKQKMKKNSV